MGHFLEYTDTYNKIIMKFLAMLIKLLMLKLVSIFMPHPVKSKTIEAIIKSRYAILSLN